MTAATHTLSEVAARYNLTPAQVVRRCRSPQPWPHLRVKKNDASTWMFTDADIDVIDDMLRHAGPAVDSWGRERRTA